MLNEADLAEYISKKGIEAEFVKLEQETPTVLAAAAAVGVRPHNIGKSILFFAEGEPIMVVANGPERLSYKPIARHLELSRRQIKLANAKEVLEFTGYPVGTVPPFGHSKRMPTYISNTIPTLEVIYVGGGADNMLLKIQPLELIGATDGEVVNLRI